MANSPGFLSERQSPISSSEPISGTPSPHVIKPTILTHKPRSSSMTSNGSIHSNHTRSMSIVSLESPRNSIVSLDDGFRPTRNNSSTSLNSLAGPGNYNGGIGLIPYNTKDTHKLFHRLKPRTNSNSVLLSDEESEGEQRQILHPARMHRTRDSNIEWSKVSHVKKDFAFHYKEPLHENTKEGPSHQNNYQHNHHHHHHQPHHSTGAHNIKSSGMENYVSSDISPSPLVLDLDSLEPTDLKMLTKKIKAVNNNKSNLMYQSLYLKKKLIYSKDIQLELIGSGVDKNVDTRFTNTPSSKHKSLLDSRSLKGQVKDFEKEPILSTLDQQNKLINKLNEKWNKSVISGSNTTDRPESAMKSRKRSRQYLFGDDDDTYDDYQT